MVRFFWHSTREQWREVPYPWRIGVAMQALAGGALCIGVLIAVAAFAKWAFI